MQGVLTSRDISRRTRIRMRLGGISHLTTAPRRDIKISVLPFFHRSVAVDFCGLSDVTCMLPCIDDVPKEGARWLLFNDFLSQR